MKLWISVPAYQGLVHNTTVQSLMALSAALANAQVHHHVTFVASSLISVSRNEAVASFLASDATHLLFCDADIAFDPQTALKALVSGFDVVGAACPLKIYDWQAVAAAARADTPASALATAGTGRFAVDFIGSAPFREVNGDRYVEVDAVGTGLLLISRAAVERIIARCGDEIQYSESERLVGSVSSDVARYDLFPCGPVPGAEGRRVYRGEDYGFCQRWKECGGKIYVFVDATISHTGMHSFVATLGGRVGARDAIEVQPAPARRALRARRFGVPS